MWAKLDDSFAVHRKVLRAGLEATGLYARCLAYAAGQHSDGKLDRGAIQMLAGVAHWEEISEALITAGLWEKTSDGNYRIHDFLDYNLSARDAKTLRKAAKERMKRYRVRSREQTKNEPQTNSEVPCLVLSTSSLSSLGKEKKADLLAGFDEWYGAYPRKESKGDAKKAWRQMAAERPSLPTMLATLAWQRPLWAQKERQYTPLPGSYLRALRWEDERPPGVAAVADVKPLSEIKVSTIAARLNARSREEVANG